MVNMNILSMSMCVCVHPAGKSVPPTPGKSGNRKTAACVYEQTHATARWRWLLLLLCVVLNWYYYYPGVVPNSYQSRVARGGGSYGPS